MSWWTTSQSSVTCSLYPIQEVGVALDIAGGRSASICGRLSSQTFQCSSPLRGRPRLRRRFGFAAFGFGAAFSRASIAVASREMAPPDGVRRNRLTNQAMTGASGKNPMLHGGQCRTTGEIIRQYVESLNKYHVGVMEDTDINEILYSIDCDVDWLESVNKRRPIFAEVTRQVDKLLKKKTPPEMAYKFRQIAVHKPNTKIQFANCMH